MSTASYLIGGLALSLLVGFTCACSSDDEPDPLAPPLGPCDGVWSSAYQTCLEEWARTCVGLQCLVASPCSGQAELALAACCADAYSTESEYQRCLDQL